MYIFNETKENYFLPSKKCVFESRFSANVEPLFCNHGQIFEAKQKLKLLYSTNIDVTVMPKMSTG